MFGICLGWVLGAMLGILNGVLMGCERRKMKKNLNSYQQCKSLLSLG
jgi:hypothetical protein